MEGSSRQSTGSYNAFLILIGGLANPELGEQVATRIATAINHKCDVVADHTEVKFVQNTTANLVNWVTADGQSGIQVEPPVIAQRYRKRAARAVASCFIDESQSVATSLCL